MVEFGNFFPILPTIKPLNIPPIKEIVEVSAACAVDPSFSSATNKEILLFKTLCKSIVQKAQPAQPKTYLFSLILPISALACPSSIGSEFKGTRARTVIKTSTANK